MAIFLAPQQELIKAKKDATTEDRRFATWSYTAQTRSGRAKKLSLDGRLELAKIENQTVLDNVKQWIKKYCVELNEVAEITNHNIFLTPSIWVNNSHFFSHVQESPWHKQKLATAS